MLQAYVSLSAYGALEDEPFSEGELISNVEDGYFYRFCGITSDRKGILVTRGTRAEKPQHADPALFGIKLLDR